MTGPLEREFAQVRSGLNRYYDFCPHMSYCAIDGDVPCDCGRDQLDEIYKDALAALSVIERHVQDMAGFVRYQELAAERAMGRASGEGYTYEQGRRDAFFEVRDRTERAALPAREKGTE